MTGTNHTIAGALIGSAVAVPVIALPLAFASHFILDFLPHFGDNSISLASKRYSIVIATDSVVVVSIFLAIFLLKPSQWPLMLVSAFVAMSPDLMWVPKYIRELRGIEPKPHTRLMHMHKKIQHELPWGLIFEILWFAATLPFLIFTAIK